jgi:hypothetical protein
MKRWLLPVGVLVVILGILGFLLRDRFIPKVAGLKVEAEPAAAVYIDGSQVGNTPYNGEMDPGEVEVKLVPLTTVTPLVPYETKVKLEVGMQTVLRRWFGTSEELSAGETLLLERYDGGDKNSGALVVISSPDAAAVRMNGVLKGFTPLVQDGVPIGDYQLALASPGWRERVINVRVEGGHRLNVTVKLAKEEEAGETGGVAASESAELVDGGETAAIATPSGKPTVIPTGQEVKKPYVEIKETPTGWLRVREEASTGAVELAKVNTGEKFPYLDKTDNGWYKIEYKKGEEGWISAQYARLTE